MGSLQVRERLVMLAQRVEKKVESARKDLRYQGNLGFKGQVRCERGLQEFKDMLE